MAVALVTLLPACGSRTSFDNEATTFGPDSSLAEIPADGARIDADRALDLVDTGDSMRDPILDADGQVGRRLCPLEQCSGKFRSPDPRCPPIEPKRFERCDLPEQPSRVLCSYCDPEQPYLPTAAPYPGWFCFAENGWVPVNVDFVCSAPPGGALDAGVRDAIQGQ
jgi:hypothetical protein